MQRRRDAVALDEKGQDPSLRPCLSFFLLTAFLRVPIFVWQVSDFVSCTGLVNLSSVSDSDLESLLSHPRLRVCTWDSTLSLAHPTVCAVLDDFDERMERFVKFYKLHDPQVAAIEKREHDAMDKGETTDRQCCSRSSDGQLHF